MTEHSVHELILEGCRPRPLASYLVAIGVLRVVAEQADPEARGAWGERGFVLHSRLDEAALLSFFADRYEPTPVVSPWNGGSGFHPPDAKDGIDFLSASEADRFADYREAIDVARRVLTELGIENKPDKADKEPLVEALRSELPDGALAWLDAALTLTNDGPKYPPLLGTGGNDGRLEFSGNFMAQLAEIFGPVEGSDRKQAAIRSNRSGWLRATLLNDAVPSLAKKAVGQFDPAAAGGANAGPGMTFASRVSPWTYVLMMEGALAFAAGTSRKLESTGPGALVFPFSVRAAGAGYGTAADVEDGSSRDELWLPLWEAPVSWTELRGLLREGRARVGRRNARNAVDFARAISRLGVARGLSGFERYGFHQRNGLSFQAVPLGRWSVRRVPEASLLDDIGSWLERLRRAASNDRTPASIQRARRDVERAVMALCADGSPASVRSLLCSLGAAERQMTRSLRWCADQNTLPPLPWLPSNWLQAALEDGEEHRLAAALAGRGLRRVLTPLGPGRWARWDENPPPGVRWFERDLQRSLISWLLREDQTGVRTAPQGTATVDAADVAWWLDHPEADAAIEELAYGVALVRAIELPYRSSFRAWLPPLFGLLHLCMDPRPLVDDRPLPRTPGLLARASSGDAEAASGLALRRLRGSGLRLGLEVRPAAQRPWQGLPGSPAATRRVAAALAFPLDLRSRQRLLSQLIAADADAEASPSTPSPTELR